MSKNKYGDIDELLTPVKDSGDTGQSSTRKRRPSPALGAIHGNRAVTTVTDTLKAEKQAIQLELETTRNKFEKEKAELVEKLDIAKSEGERAAVNLEMPVSKKTITFKLERIDPSLIDVSPENERIQGFLDEVSLHDILSSITIHGQQKPGTVRPKNGRYELIEGSRRLAAVKLAGHQYLALVGEVPDEDIRELSVIENKHKDVSYYEKAKAYERQIANGEFKNWTLLGQEMGISSSHISRYRACAELDELFVKILTSPSDMPLIYGENIAQFLKKDKESVYKKARELIAERSQKKFSADQILKALKSAIATKVVKPKAKKPIVYSSKDGNVILKHSITRAEGNTKFEISGVSDETLEKIRGYLIQVLNVQEGEGKP